ncbi:hypothetical protein [Aeromonas intestinalis]
MASSSKRNARPEVPVQTSLTGAPRYARGVLLSPGIIHRALSALPSGHMRWRNDDIAINRRAFALFINPENNRRYISIPGYCTGKNNDFVIFVTHHEITIRFSFAHVSQSVDPE